MPKFLLMVNHDNGVVNGPMSEWEPDEVRAHMNYYEILGRELTESGEQIQFMALADPGWPGSCARTVPRRRS